MNDWFSTLAVSAVTLVLLVTYFTGSKKHQKVTKLLHLQQAKGIIVHVFQSKLSRIKFACFVPFQFADPTFFSQSLVILSGLSEHENLSC